MLVDWHLCHSQPHFPMSVWTFKHYLEYIPSIWHSFPKIFHLNLQISLFEVESVVACFHFRPVCVCVCVCMCVRVCVCVCVRAMQREERTWAALAPVNACAREFSDSDRAC